MCVVPTSIRTIVRMKASGRKIRNFKQSFSLMYNVHSNSGIPSRVMVVKRRFCNCIVFVQCPAWSLLLLPWVMVGYTVHEWRPYITRNVYGILCSSTLHYCRYNLKNLPTFTTYFVSFEIRNMDDKLAQKLSQNS